MVEKCSSSCDGISEFFHDMIFVEVSELNGIAWISLVPFVSGLSFVNVLSTFKMDAVDS